MHDITFVSTGESTELSKSPFHHWGSMKFLQKYVRYSRITFFVILAIFFSFSIAQNVKIGGWAGFTYSDNAKVNNIGGFDAHPWYLYFTAEPAEGYKFLGEFEAEHAFRISKAGDEKGAFLIERLYIERNFTKAHNLRLGKFFMPFGYWYRLHWNFLTETLTRPLTFDNSYAPRSQVGVQYFGQIYVENTSIIYYSWIGNGIDQFGTDSREVESLAFGGSIFLEHLFNSEKEKSIGTTIGYHNQAVKNGENIDGSVKEMFQSNLVLGAKFHYDFLELRSEYYYHDRGGDSELYSWYATANVELFEGFFVTTRFEKGDDQEKINGDEISISSQHKSYGLIWRPRAVVLIKCEYRFNDYNDVIDDFNEWNIFFALKF